MNHLSTVNLKNTMVDSNDSFQHVHSNAIHESMDMQQETQYPIARAVFTSTSFRSHSSGSSSERWIYPEPVSCVIVDEEESTISFRKHRWVEFLAVGITVIVIVVITMSLRGFPGSTKGLPNPVGNPIPKQTIRPTPNPTPTPTSFPTPSPTKDSSSTFSTQPSLPQPSDFTSIVSPTMAPASVFFPGPSEEAQRRPRTRAPSGEESMAGLPTVPPTISSASSTSPPVRQPPPIREDIDWMDVSPELNITQAISVSVSFTGDIIAILNGKGICVLKQDIDSGDWLEYGEGGISPLALSGSARTLPFDELLQSVMTTEVTLSSDGKRLFWYITYKINRQEESGHALIFELVDQGDTMQWIQVGETKILGTSPGSEKSRCFGPVVAFARDSADTIVSGTRLTALDINFGIPKVHKLHRNGKWSDETKDFLIDYRIKDIEDVVFNPLAGVSVAISGNGQSIAVSSPDSGEGIIGDEKDSGKVQVFEPSRSSFLSLSNWKFKGQAVRGTFENNKFGIVSMSNDGNTMVVGTPNKENREKPGEFRVVKYSNGEWAQVMEDFAQSPSFGITDGKFGQVVTISPDGNVVAVAHPLTGEVCVYDIARKELIGPCLQEVRPNNFSLLNVKLALSWDGSRLVISIPPSATEVGYLKVYDLKE